MSLTLVTFATDTVISGTTVSDFVVLNVAIFGCDGLACDGLGHGELRHCDVWNIGVSGQEHPQGNSALALGNNSLANQIAYF